VRRRAARAFGSVIGLGLALLILPLGAAAHALSRSFESRLPLAVYLAGAAGAVALSFAFVLVRDLRAAAPREDGRGRRVPGAVRVTLRAVGLLALAWIVVQGIAGGGSDAEVSRLFAWVYGWVGVAMISALAFPIWPWLDPFRTLHDLGARALKAARIDGIAPAPYPARLGRWPAVIGFAGVVWLELVATGAGSQTLALVITGYTVFTLAMMAQYGRQAWTEHGEIFSVWFGLLGRLAPLAPARSGEEGVLRRRGFTAGLLEGGWSVSDIVMIGLGTGSILFDGLSQTEAWVSAFGLPAALPQTVILTAFLALIIGAALVVARLVGVPATAAGLLPIAVGYLVAHYFAYLVTEGQRIVIAISDPLQQGSNLFGTAFFQPNAAWLPPAVVWTLQLGAVVGGHMVGAWSGHAVATAEARRRGATAARDARLRQVPLAMVMVALTTVTLWSLGQALFIPTP
jgi:hypothetical protein